jgi:hypothetical protein
MFDYTVMAWLIMAAFVAGIVSAVIICSFME